MNGQSISYQGAHFRPVLGHGYSSSIPMQYNRGPLHPYGSNVHIHQLFGADMDSVLDELNEMVAA